MIVLLSLFFAFSASTQETHDDIIRKAQTLILQRDRDKALQVMQFAVDKETNNVVATKKLVAAMTQMGEMVFTERGQQVLESAESLVTSDPPQALDLYKDAIKIEQGNLRIETQMAKAYFLMDDCDNAAAQAESILQTHPWHEAGLFLLAQARICKNSSFILKPSQITLIPDELIKLYVSSAQALLQKDYAKVVKDTTAGVKKFPEFSEFYWFRAQALEAQSQDGSKDKAKYKELCNAKTSTLPPPKNLLYSCKNKDKV